MRFLICTDVAARGLDISGLPYVVNVTLPDRAEDYIHRVGRVGEPMARSKPPAALLYACLRQSSSIYQTMLITTHMG